MGVLTDLLLQKRRQGFIDDERRKTRLSEDFSRRQQAGRSQAGFNALLGAQGPVSTDLGGFDPFATQTPSAQARTLGLLGEGGPLAQEAGRQALTSIQGGGQGGGIGRPSPKNFTVESLADFQQSNDPRDLVRFFDPLELRRANQADDRLALSHLLAGRPSPAMQEKIIQDQISLDTLDSIVQQSDPNFFGMGFELVADARKEVARRFGDEDERRFLDFWREYEFWIQEIRIRMFGSQFTVNEERTFDALKIKPIDSHAVAMSNMQMQRDMVNRARMRRSSVLTEFGFDIPEPSIRGGGDAGVIDKRAAP